MADLLTLPEVTIAKYILQVNLIFRPDTANKLGSFNVWKKSGWFGHSDDLMKFCPRDGCTGVFDDSFDMTKEEMDRIGEENVTNVRAWPVDIRAKYADWYRLPVLCTKCGTMAIREELPDSYGFNMTMDRIADRMAHIYQESLYSDADIYMVRSKNGKAFVKAKEELSSADYNFDRYKKQLERARDRESVFYPLKNIVADTANGSTLSNRFKFLLEA